MRVLEGIQACARTASAVCERVWTPAIKWTHQDQMRQRGRHCPVKIPSLIRTDEPVSFKVSIIIIQQDCITVLTAYLSAHTQTEERDNTRIF